MQNPPIEQIIARLRSSGKVTLAVVAQVLGMTQQPHSEDAGKPWGQE